MSHIHPQREQHLQHSSCRSCIAYMHHIYTHSRSVARFSLLHVPSSAMLCYAGNSPHSGAWRGGQLAPISPGRAPRGLICAPHCAAGRPHAQSGAPAETGRDNLAEPGASRSCHVSMHCRDVVAHPLTATCHPKLLILPAPWFSNIVICSSWRRTHCSCHRLPWIFACCTVPICIPPFNPILHTFESASD